MFIKEIPLPQKIETKEFSKDKAQITIEPCYPGYGVTLGNSLRRVLLSSLEGAAVTAFKLNNVPHEFSTIPYVKEDLVQIILNLKKLRLKMHTDETVKLELKVKGEKQITAGDITKNSEVDIINKDLVLATLTDKKGELDMELTANKGRGYVTVESREKEKLEIGNIAIDALYSPVINVGFEIENVRVGQKTDFEKIILTVETDGSIKPEDALKDSTKILVDHFQKILNPEATIDSEEVPAEEVLETAEEIKDEEAIEEKETVEKEEKEEEPKEPVKKKRGRPKKTDK